MTWRKVIFTPSCLINYTTKGRYTLWNQFRSSDTPYNYFVHIWSTGTGCVEYHVVEWSAWRIAFVVCIIRVPWVLLNACDNSTTAESLSCVDHIVNVHLIRGDFVAFFSRVGAHFARVSFELFYTFRASRTHAAMSVCVCVSACLFIRSSLHVVFVCLSPYYSDSTFLLRITRIARNCRHFSKRTNGTPGVQW